jgi:two-component system chemotaxis response regulator CheY
LDEPKGKKVLIVDDATIIRLMLKKMLARYGVVVAGEALDGEEAIRMFEALQPDFVTMDITMPNLDGISATRQILTRHSSARIIMVSALGQERKVKEAIEAGALDFIVKPLKEERLISSVRRVLYGAPGKTKVKPKKKADTGN